MLQTRAALKETKDAAQKERSDSRSAKIKEKSAQDIALGQAVLRDAVGTSLQSLTLVKLHAMMFSAQQTLPSTAKKTEAIQLVQTYLSTLGRITPDGKIAALALPAAPGSQEQSGTSLH